MTTDLASIYDRLFAYCKAQNFAGYDPFDGLNSRVFKATPLRHSRFARLAFLQAVKRSPVDPRRLAMVSSGVNAKTLALVALAEISRFRATRDERHRADAEHLLGMLTDMRVIGTTPAQKATAAFGYNFDWQSRHFFVPQGTPAVVPTAFACNAFLEGYAAFREERYLDTAIEICRFVLTDLNRYGESDDEMCFSYTPLDRSRVFNASLLAAECLAQVGDFLDTDEYLALAAKALTYVVRRQRVDGAFVYGEGDKQGWVDNFHTAFVLTSIKRIAVAIPDLKEQANDALRRGMSYWLGNFFLDDGTPKYYDRSIYPIDIHSAATAIAALSGLRDLDPRSFPLAHKVAEWTIANMRDERGFFYYRQTQRGLIKTPFMRWGQAWMAFGLARLIEAAA